MKNTTTYEIYFYFDTNKHRINPFLLSEGIELYKIAFEEIAQLYTNEKVSITFELCTPERGSWKACIYVTLLGLGLLWKFADSEFGSGFIEGLLGKDVKTLGREVGISIKDLVHNVFIKSAKEIENIPEYSKLNSLWIRRNKWYEECLEDKSIERFALSENGTEFFIKKKDFAIPIYIEEDIELEDIQEMSVNLEKVSLRKDNQWGGQNKNKAINFWILDTEFWKRMKNNSITIPSTIVVQYIQIKNTDKIYVVTVLQYNNNIYPPITEEKLAEYKEVIYTKKKEKKNMAITSKQYKNEQYTLL